MPTSYGSTTEMGDEESSGYGLTSLPVTTEVPVPNILGTPTSVMILTTSDQGVQTATTSTEVENLEPTASAEMEDLHPALIYGVPAVLLLVLIVLLVVLIVRRRKQKQPKQEELASESCKSPIFEEDTPSVMEIEMEELDKWMSSLKRNTECEYLPSVKEEKDCNASPRSEIQSKELAFNFLSGNDADTSHRFEQMRATETGNHSINECSMDIISNNQELSEDLEQGNTARI